MGYVFCSELGAHVDGFIAVAAHTKVVGSSKVSDLVCSIWSCLVHFSQDNSIMLLVSECKCVIFMCKCIYFVYVLVGVVILVALVIRYSSG